MKKRNLSLRITIFIIIFFLISLFSIYSSMNIAHDYTGNIFFKQIIYYLLGIGVLITSYFYKKEIFKYSYLLYFICLFFLGLLLVLGYSINGSKCWLIIGSFSFQPSEFMKIALIISLSKIIYKFDGYHKMIDEIKMFVIILMIISLPVILTFLEPDTGMVIIYCVIMLGILIYRGINKKWYYLLIIISVIMSITITYLYIYHQTFLTNILGSSLFYRMERILNWWQNSGYQLENSLIAIASAGIYGFGFNHTPLYFPEASTDFIFTTFASNVGLIGSIILIIVIVAFDKSILSLSNKRINKIDKYFIMGVFSMIVYQQIQNIGMTIGLLPITGITLPFISYGGSSLLSYMFIMGCLLNIAKTIKIN